MRIDNYSLREILLLNDILSTANGRTHYQVVVDDRSTSWKSFSLRKECGETGDVPFELDTVLKLVHELNEYRIHKHCTNLSDSLDALIEFDQMVPVIFYLIECSMEDLPLLMSSSYGWVRDLVKYRFSINK